MFSVRNAADIINQSLLPVIAGMLCFTAGPLVRREAINLKSYELLLIITPDRDESEAEALTANVQGIIENGGTLLKVDAWGKKRLAYPIQKRTEGYYVLYIFESAPSFIAELNQSLRVIEAIMRHMIVLYEGDAEELKSAAE